MLRTIIAVFILTGLSVPSSTQPITTVQELLQATVKATGGEDAWRKIKAMELQEEANGGQLGTGIISITARYPGFYRYSYQHGERDFLLQGLFVPGKSPVSWIVMNGQERENRPPNSRSNLFASEEMNMLYDSAWQFKPLRTEQREGKSYYVVEGRYKELTQIRYYNTASFLPERMEQETDGGIKSVSQFSDYRLTDGVTRAWQVQREVEDPQFGNSQSSEKIMSLQYNGAIKEESFIRQ